ncbi:MAG TPA: peptidase C39 family protein [Verrucomicrobiae bacterium]|nr:peptidase C39 family protein [Verrucomicrobiae bacterium]
MKRFVILALALIPLLSHATDFRGAQFIGFSDFADFQKEGPTLTSKLIEPAISWDELVVSWNLRGKGEATFEARLIYPDVTSTWYQLAIWSASGGRSVNGQDDENAKVDTDTLHAKKPGAKVEVRVTLKDARMEDLKFLSLAFRDSKAKPEPLESNRRVWGKVVQVGTRSQLDYPEGAKIWCSPTSTSMILDYWSHKLNRDELSLTVPDVAKGVYDSVYKGTGNWPCNTAFAGNFQGMRAYVTRLTDVSELEDWIAAGIPIATSVSYNRLKGKGTSGSGHLIVCVGFTESGDIAVNDPGTKLSNVRRSFPRDLFREAWADSGNTVYIIYPENALIPAARFGHWENTATR